MNSMPNSYKHYTDSEENDFSDKSREYNNSNFSADESKNLDEQSDRDRKSYAGEQQTEESYGEYEEVGTQEIAEASDEMNLSFENSTIYSSSNAGTPIENPDILAGVADGKDLDKLDFSSNYASPNGEGNDELTGTAGVNTFYINPLLNAKPEIYQKHTDSDGKINWRNVAGENSNYHDHWVDGIGQDTITDFSGNGGEGDKINIVGHTVAVTVLEESDSQVKLGIYSDQNADGARGTNAHDLDVLGTLTVNHDGNFDYDSDVSVTSNVFDGAFEFA